jgi:hypothetical protein
MPNCGTIYLNIPDSVISFMEIRCSSCDAFLGTWRELETDFYEQGGGQGIFELRVAIVMAIGCYFR